MSTMTITELLTNFDDNVRNALQGAVPILPTVLVLWLNLMLMIWALRKIATILWGPPREPRQDAEKQTSAAWTTPNEVQAQSSAAGADAELERLRRAVEKGQR